MRFVLLGVLYGTVLATGGILSAGAGHGTYIPAALYGSPLSVFGITGALLGAPLYWGVFGLLLSGQSVRGNVLAWTLVGIHYLVAVLGWLGVMRVEFADWADLWKSWDQLAVAVAVSLTCYLLGQVWIWARLLKLASSGGVAPAGA